MTTPDEASDQQVVAAILGGRPDMYRILVVRYQDVLFRHAARMIGGSDDAADIVQRALVKGFQKLRSCQDPAKVGGWLFRIMGNLCKDHLKSRRRRDVSLDELGVSPVDGYDPGDDLDRAELRRSLERALASLGHEQREAFVLKHMEGCSYDRMSELLGVSVPALKMRVHRAREELQGLLEVYR